MRSYPCAVAGLRYRHPDGHDRGRYALRLRRGDELDLEPEPENPYDDNAVAFLHEGFHLGYVPTKSEWVSESIAEGDSLRATITKIETSGFWLWRRVTTIIVSIAIIADG